MIIVCDDDTVHLTHTMDCLQANPLLATATIDSYSDPSGMLIDVERNQVKPDIAILDIAMPDSGIAIARRLNER